MRDDITDSLPLPGWDAGCDPKNRTGLTNALRQPLPYCAKTYLTKGFWKRVVIGCFF